MNFIHLIITDEFYNNYMPDEKRCFNTFSLCCADTGIALYEPILYTCCYCANIIPINLNDINSVVGSDIMLPESIVAKLKIRRIIGYFFGGVCSSRLRLFQNGF